MHDVEEAALPFRERELHQSPAAVVDLLDHQAGHGTVGEDHAGTGLEPPARLHETLPGALVALAKQEDLDGTTGLVLDAEKPRREHSRVVDDHHVAFAQVVGQIREDPVVHLTARTVEHQQPAGVARLSGLLGDQPGRQFVVEVVCQHGAGVSSGAGWRTPRVYRSRSVDSRRDTPPRWRRESGARGLPCGLLLGTLGPSERALLLGLGVGVHAAAVVLAVHLQLP